MVGFDQDESSGEGDERDEVCRGLFAAQGDAFEAFAPSLDGPIWKCHALASGARSGMAEYPKRGRTMIGRAVVAQAPESSKSSISGKASMSYIGMSQTDATDACH